MKCEEREVICRDGRAALLRSAHPDDAAEMVRFLLDVCGETEFLLAYPEERQSLTDEGERTFLTRLTADDNELMLTAWVDGQLAGVANINFSTRLKMRHRANVAISIRRAYWLVYHESMRGVPRIRAVAAFIADAVERERHLFE